MTNRQATLIDFEDMNPDLRILTLKPTKKMSYKAGQYLELSADGFSPRPYSIANAPQEDGTITLHIRKQGTLSTQKKRMDYT